MLDGIDECKDSDRLMLIRVLQEFHSRSRKKPQDGSVLKFLVTRRPCVAMDQQLHGPVENCLEVLLGNEDAIEGM